MRLRPARLELAMMVVFVVAILATVLYMVDYAGVISLIPIFLI